MTFIDEKTANKLREELNNLNENVTLTFFKTEKDCPYCPDIKNLLSEFSGLSEKLSLKIADYDNEADTVEKYRLDKAPAIVVEGRKDYGIRFFGIPSGYEFSTLLQAVKDVSAGVSGLSEDARKSLANIQKDISLKVFVTPTCPYCPGAAVLANKFAIENDRINAETVEASEFPTLSAQYKVQGVPHTVVNEVMDIVGMVPEAELLNKVLDNANVH